MTRDMRGGEAGLVETWNDGMDGSGLGGVFGGALGADAVDRDIGAADAGSGGELPELRGVECHLMRVGVADLSAGVAVEMDVLVEVGAVAGLRALDMDGLDEAAGGEVVQAIVNGGQRDTRRPVLDAMEDVVGRGVVVRLGEDLEDFAAVRGEPDVIGTKHGQTAVEAGGLLRRAGGGGRRHGERAWVSGFELEQE